MKKTLKPILSLLLAFAMLLPMAGVARADTYSGSISLSPTDTSLFYGTGSPKTSTTITATVADNYDHGITWEVTNDNNLVTYTSPDANSNQKTLTLTVSDNATGAGDVTVTAKVKKDASTDVSSSVTIHVAPDALIESTPITITPATPTVYTGSTTTLTATAKYKSGREVTSASSPSSFTFTSDNTSYATVEEHTGIVTGVAAGSATITAAYAGENSITRNSTVSVTVSEDSLIDDNPVTLAPSTAEIAVGGHTTLTATAKYKSGRNVTTPSSFDFTSNDNSVATVDANGYVTGIAPGTATITATYTGTNQSATVTVKVTQPSTTVSDSTAVNTKKSLSDVYSRLRNNFYDSYNAYPSDNATIAFTAFDSTTAGTLYDKSGNAVSRNYSYTFSDLSGFYLDAVKEGTSQFSVTVQDGSRQLSATVTITVSITTANIRVPVDGDDDYEFGYKAYDTSKTGSELIDNALSDTGYRSITFGSVQSGSNVGTLYTSSGKKTVVGNGTTVNKADLDSLYFVADKSQGVYRISYVAYANENGENAQTKSQVAKGELSIVVNPTSLNVSVTLDKVEPYTFSQAPSTGTTTSSSAANKLLDAIDGALGSSGWSYVCFDSPSSSSASVGTLYSSSSASSAIKSTYEANRNYISSLYFVPSEIGTYEVGFGVYDRSNGTPIATGTLTIDVASILGDANFQYTVGFGKSVTLDEDDFAAFLSDKLGGTFTLSTVVFNGYSGKGTFYYNSKSFTPGGSTEYYATTYEGRVPTNSRYIDEVSFTAPNSGAGYTAVSFTAYGVSGSRTRSAAGVFYIFYPDNIPVITYDVYGSSSLSLRESDFVSVYKTAMNSNSANPQFRIRLQSVPDKGFLYQSSTSSTRNNTQLTSGNVASNYYTVGATSSARSITNVSYSPLPLNGDTTDKITYIAYNTNDTPLFTGEIVFKSIAPRTATVASDGLDFSANDFYVAGDSDPVEYVTFKTPTSGKLYVTASNGFVPVSESTRLYTLDATKGSYPISQTHYVPMAGQTAPVTLIYTAHTKSGASYDNSIVVTPTSKTASSKFADVNGNIGRWAANSVDFASKYGFVQGVGNGNFDPNSTMRRCDLVLILYRMSGSPVVSGVMPYTDVSTGTTSYAIEIYNSALWAYRNGIMDGLVTDSKYLPTTNITRQDYVRILYNYAKSQGISVSNSASLAGYDDASSVAAYATAAMQWAVAKNYVNGTSSDPAHPTLSPTRDASRAEIVTLLHRYLTF